MKVLVEVNIGREESKGGVLPEALLECIDEIRTFPGLRVEASWPSRPSARTGPSFAGIFPPSGNIMLT